MVLFFQEQIRGTWLGRGTATCLYLNTQGPSTLWFHDHTLGITRLNVYAGPVGFYIICSDAASTHPTVGL